MQESSIDARLAARSPAAAWASNPRAQLPERLSEVPKDQEVVVVCRSGNRSQAGRDILLDAGFSQVASMNGGMNNWSEKGYPTASGR